MDISVPIAAEVKQIAFSFATGEEIKKLSVKAINNPQTFDPVTQYPNVGGLYDPALGPFDKSQMCQTCRMNYFQCPGHFGHVELAVPVYHPLLFGTLFNILRAKCFFCHHFKLGGNKLYRYEARLKLLYAGLLKESMELENFDVTSLSVPQEEALEVDGKNKVMDSKDFAMKIDHYVKNALKSAEAGKFEAELVSATNDYLKTLTKDLLKELIAAKKCNHCDAKSPTLRKESHSKIFENAMSATDLAQLQSKGFKREGLLAGSATPASRLSPNASVETRAEDEVKQSKSVYLTSSQIKEHMKLLWENEGPLLDLIFGSVSYTNSKGAARKSSYEQFFINTVAVPPTRFRPVSVMGDKQFDNVQNTFLADIIKFNNSIIDLSNSKKLSEKQEDLDEQTKFKRLITAWVSLQESVNNLHDATKNPKRGSPTNGIKQIMEKKEGLFRKHMMGKRVNYAARSVISPDPMIETSEIGVPMVFAKKLTYPEPVTQYNVTEMREAVINGPDVYPGATAVQLEDGTLTMLPSVKEQRIAIANQLLKPAPHLRPGEDIQYVNKKVYRHVKNGDMLLMNRQPTLHKPSIMAHTARILPGEKTIRMHYANCNTYNADFDGDEMNMHFPQNAIAQAEARLIMNNNNQYLVPTNGEPLRGLIQDHVVTGVMMSSRDTFLTREEYVNVIYASLVDHVPGRLRTIPPAMVKPQQLWTGKQVISTLLLNLTLGKQQLNLDSKSQVPSKSWSVLQKVDTEEGHVIIRDGNLLTGVLDKKQFGAKPYGLVHAVYEVYGADVAGKLLTCLGRLFTKYVQMIGFSCRMEDLVLDPEADKYRQEKIKRALAQGKQILKDFASESGELALIAESPLENTLKKKLYNSKMSADERDRTEKMLSALEDKRLYQAMENTIRSDAKLAQLDGKMKGNTGSVTTEIVKQLLPNGLRIPFPENGMQLMTVSGAKGSNVNVTQISCMLGQQELEGRRVPVMVSGKTLPSFRAYDLGPRAGGYITGRFLTGIKPQEYYFHCMAGREGLVDTAVKTARSGYLQRCLIKHLEGMKVNYDATVRDSADGSVYQFHYGEDSLDVTKASYLKDFKFNSQNYRALLQRYNAEEAAKALDTKKAEKYNKKAFKKPEKYQPALSKYNPHRYLGSVSESFYQDVKKYVEKNPDKILGNEALDFPSKEAFEVFMFLKYHRCLVDPGEAVGLLAAQSIGEPSTQMTLNTFHFAGHGAKNVTLGIPRLREIIMTASTQLKTPQMAAPFTKDVTKAQAELIARKMSRLTLDMLMVSASVTETMLPLGSGGRERSYRVRLHFCKEEDYNREYDLSFEELRDNVEKVFIKKLVMAIKKADKKRQNNEEAVDEIGKGTDTSRFNESSSAVIKPDEETSSSSKKKKIKSVVSDDENDDALDEDAHAASRAKKKKQHASYDEPDEEEKIKYSSDSDSEAEDENNADEKSYAQGMDLDEEQSLVREDVIKSNSFVCDYKFDVVSKEWCEVELRFPAKNKKLLMVDIVESVAPSCIISEIPGISKCFVTKDEKDHLVMITEGVNIPGLFPYEKYIDVTGIQSNDIASIIKTYGVEAGRKTIMKEISSVFGVYGIDVDLRHLSLIADYMTFAGGYRAFNRGGIESNASPFSKMSFETAFHFLITSTLRGDVDNLRSPSARLVLGKVVEGGTGAFEVLHQMK